MNEDEVLHFTLVDKRTGKNYTITDKSYTVVVRRALVYMNKEMREPIR